MKQLIIIVLFCTYIILCFSGCGKHDVILQPAYAIGIIKTYQKASGEGTDNSIVYNYTINGVQYANYYTDHQFGTKWEVPFGNYQKGNMYMVEYNVGCVSGDRCNDPAESRMLFNYPVQDSTDYKNYVSQFAVTPPTP